MISIYDIIIMGTGIIAVIGSFMKKKEVGLIALLIFFFFIILKITLKI